jgi:hypothetical protein
VQNRDKTLPDWLGIEEIAFSLGLSKVITKNQLSKPVEARNKAFRDCYDSFVRHTHKIIKKHRLESFDDLKTIYMIKNEYAESPFAHRDSVSGQQLSSLVNLRLEITHIDELGLRLGISKRTIFRLKNPDQAYEIKLMYPVFWCLMNDLRVKAA